MATSLVVPRSFAAAAGAGGAMYLAGGFDYDGGAVPEVLDSVERAELLPDAGLGPFAMTGATLAAARGRAAAVEEGGLLLLIGGQGPAGPRADLEAAPLSPAGLGAFAAVPGAALQTPRAGAAAAVVGDTVVVAGGDAPTPDGGWVRLDSVEQAPLFPDGGVGPFQLLPGALPFPVADAKLRVAGDQLLLYAGVLFDADAGAGGQPEIDGGLFEDTNALVGAPLSGDAVGAFAELGTHLFASHGQVVDLRLGDTLFLIAGGTTLGEEVVLGPSGVDHVEPPGSFQAPDGRRGASLVELGGGLYLVGGALPTSAVVDHPWNDVTTVYRAPLRP